MAQNGKKSKRAELIDENLKRVYADLLDEELPDRFKDLLAQLKSQNSSGRDGDAQ